ncbi:hypothetical protein [Pontiella sulfatireligans]|uniref:Uncharacterized protein n=1 Tax=Pontiella sulfatireligans TaxID=2750658 RepID=A0A6C2UT52_9BACT|nr:hypothetical protein [Pontiella sulfatireligans]VGO22076.1 hypothetical protein SCARR_04157 [Pontiella sulfatireligans]
MEALRGNKSEAAYLLRESEFMYVDVRSIKLHYEDGYPARGVEEMMESWHMSSDLEGLGGKSVRPSFPGHAAPFPPAFLSNALIRRRLCLALGWMLTGCAHYAVPGDPAVDGKIRLQEQLMALDPSVRSNEAHRVAVGRRFLRTRIGPRRLRFGTMFWSTSVCATGGFATTGRRT